MSQFSVTDIPGIMEENQWNLAADLLQRWFDGEANADPSLGTPSISDVKMEWLLGFPRAKRAYDEIFSEQFWMTALAQEAIRRVLQRNGLVRPGACVRVSSEGVQLPQAHRDHIQTKQVGGGAWQMATGQIDGLRAALARFNFHVLVFGTVIGPGTQKARTLIQPELRSVSGIRFESPSSQFVISKIGVYAKDSYDFNGDQPLGNWDKGDASVGRTIFNGGTGVSNADFREWRQTHKKGGDYLIYSDIRLTTLSHPCVVHLPG